MNHIAERWPAALRLDEAADYSGLSVETFKAVCPVKPIQFTASARGRRWLRARIDDWLLSIDPNSGQSSEPELGRVKRLEDYFDGDPGEARRP
jgi:hypothetical protein